MSARGEAARRVYLIGLMLVCGCASSTPQPSAKRSSPAVTESQVRQPSCEQMPGRAGCPPIRDPSAIAATPSESPAEASPKAEASISGGLATGDGTPLDKALERGDRALDAGRLDEAEQAYSKAARLDSDRPAPQVGLVRVALARLDVDQSFGAAPDDARLEALLKELDVVLKEHPAYGPAILERGRVLLILGRGPPALEALRRSAQMAPSDAEAQSTLGIALLATGDTEGALRYLDRAAKLEPEVAERLANLGTALMMRGRIAEAIGVYRRAAKLAPDDARIHGDLGTAYLAEGRAKPALTHLKRAMELAPERATFLSNYGYALLLLDELDRAIEVFKKALKLDPALGSAWINLGNALAKQHRYGQARDALEKALELDPSDPRAQSSLEELDALAEGGSR